MEFREFMKKAAHFFYAVLYSCCLHTGLFVLDMTDGLSHSLSAWLQRIEKRIGLALLALKHLVIREIKALLWRLQDWCSRVTSGSSSIALGVRQLSRGLVKDSGRLFLHALRAFAWALYPVVATLFHYALPVLAIFALYGVIQKANDTHYALRVRYSGAQGLTDFGYIDSESVYDRAITEVLQKMQGIINNTPVDFSAQFELEQVSAFQPTLDAYELSDKIISASGGDIETAYGLYVDDVFIDAVREKDPLLDLLVLIQDRYKSGDPSETVQFNKSIAVREGLYPHGRVKSLSQINAQIGGEVRGEFIYLAQQGDSPSSIAQRFDVPQSQIVANNPGILTSLLVGDKILISRAEPYLSVKIRRIETYDEAIPFSTEIREDPTLFKDQRKTVREGKNGTERIRAAVTYVNDIESNRDILKREQLVEPISQQDTVGTKMFMQNYGDGRVTANFITPVPNMNYISNYFYGSNFSRYFHGALDYAANYGTPIYASAPGVVTYSSYTATGYGHHVIVTHSDGFQTLYAHMSSRAVRVGNKVDQGQILGYVGSTGNSSGNHCHFEILQNGTKLDPLAYVG